MVKKYRAVVGLALAGIMVSTVAYGRRAAEPALRAQEIVGNVMVQRPGQSSFESIEDGITYAYGSRFRTGVDSSVVLVLSHRNTVRVMAGTEILFSEGRHERAVKIVRVESGEVEAKLESTFRDAGNILQIEAGNTVTQLIGTHVRVGSRTEQDLRVVIVRVLAGVVRTLGENFDIKELKTDQWVSIVSPQDESFLNVKNLRGNFPVTIRDEDKSDKNLPTEEGSVLKIWQRVVPGTLERVITVNFLDSTGTQQESVSVTYGPDEYAGFLSSIRESSGTVVERRPYSDQANPVPPDGFLGQLIERTLADLNSGAGRTFALQQIAATPPGQALPSVTPVGGQ